ncbi:MAG: hypothetical protein V4736_13720 [Bdellovibrionota bacterium]
MKKLLLIALASVSFKAQAYEISKISCMFTEPFFSVSYDAKSKTMILLSAEEPNKRVTKNVGMNQKNGKIYINHLGKDIMEITTNFNGSDGMSDRIYPMEAKMLSPNANQYASNLIGGCETKYLKAQEGQY